MLKVLIAEDNVMLADMLEDFLASEGYEVCGLARTVEEAVALANLHKPDLGVFDYRLADGKSGSCIRPLLKDKNIGILYASGDALNTTLTKSDGEAYIQKPYSLDDILMSLHIIQKIKTGDKISTSVFPNHFHLLENPVDIRIEAA